MRKVTFLVTLVTALAITVFIVSCNNNGQKANSQESVITNDSLIKRGSYLVVIMGCDDCHSPKIMGAQGPEPDLSRRLSGHPVQMPLGKINADALKSWVLFNPFNTAIVGPWGVSFASNLTSSETGIGNWSQEQFFKAIRKGKSKGLDDARMLLPPMPWQNIAKASDEDLKAIYAYLKSTKPIDNLVPQPLSPAQVAKQAK